MSNEGQITFILTLLYIHTYQRPEGPEANVFIIAYGSNEPSSDILFNSAITSSKRVLLKKNRSKIFKIYDRFTVDGKVPDHVASPD